MIEDSKLSVDLTKQFKTKMINDNIDLGVRFSMDVLQVSKF